MDRFTDIRVQFRTINSVSLLIQNTKREQSIHLVFFPPFFNYIATKTNCGHKLKASKIVRRSSHMKKYMYIWTFPYEHLVVNIIREIRS